MLVVECPSTRGSSQAQEVSLTADANPERVTFRQCDPMCLPAGLAGERSVLELTCFARFSFCFGSLTPYVWRRTCFGYVFIIVEYLEFFYLPRCSIHLFISL